MVKTGKFEVPYYIYKVPNHKEIKPLILEKIKESPGTPSYTSYEELLKSDWYTNRDNAFFYQNFIQNKDSYYAIVEPHISYIIQEIIPDKNKKSFAVSNGWFHQYTKYNHYTWHDHPSVRWATVYYLELGPNGPITEFENFYGKSIVPDVEEGDILIFPGWIKHRAPPNLTTHRKTILSFNIGEKSSFEINLPVNTAV